MESEAVATGKAGELVGHAREILRLFGVLPRGPTVLFTDNKANMLMANGTAMPARSRHCLRRYTTYLERVRMGEVITQYVRDQDNVADFMTKFVPKEKAERSVDYATNAKNVVKVTA